MPEDSLEKGSSLEEQPAARGPLRTVTSETAPPASDPTLRAAPRTTIIVLPQEGGGVIRVTGGVEMRVPGPVTITDLRTSPAS